MIGFSVLVMYPFFLGFIWSGIIVIATWPILLKLQNFIGGKRSLAIFSIIILLILLFVMPVLFLLHAVIGNTIPIMYFIHFSRMFLPNLIWLQDFPFLGTKIFLQYQRLLQEGSGCFFSNVQPYIKSTTSFFFIQVSFFGKLLIHVFFMLICSIILYWNGEKISNIIRYFSFRLGSRIGYIIVLLATKSIRAIALGVVATAFIQGFLSGVVLITYNIVYPIFFIILIIFFCLIQVGALLVLIPIIIWLYWCGDVYKGSVLLLWSGLIFFLDSILRTKLIKIHANLPSWIIFSGVIGGLIAFGFIGIFVGPVILFISCRLFSFWIYKTSIFYFLSHSLPYQKVKRIKFNKNV
ncbi:AI-2E family transporter YdiK [Buchnera aphidicola (Kurisakia onigurumii)]|uniref:AI-2E family transporter YdiK n=1 Tax=Buchnera aphidicola TaxID=9 RepID=UPI0031B6DE63